MKTMRWLAAAGAIAAAAVAGPVLAQERGLYLGGSVGAAEYRNACNAFAPGDACDDIDTGFRVFAGYQFNRNAALEIAYVDLGVAKAEGTVLGVPTSAREDGTGFDLTGVISLPLAGGLSVFGRLGIYYMRSQVDINSGGAVSRSDAWNGGFTYGAGISFDLWRLGLRAEWQRYDSAVGGGFAAEDDVNFYSVGALFRF